MSAEHSNRRLDGDPPGTGFMGDSPEFVSLVRQAEVIARTDVTVLIEGESGTGKDMLARMIHGSSRRAASPLHVVNCAALPESLVESELFGHRRGAFTGAISDATGRIPASDGATLFLDEIGELPLAVQPKLLRVLENGECQSLGARSTRKVDVRVLAATNRKLWQRVQDGTFREDLYYRLNIVPLHIPALRARRGDIIPLLHAFTRTLASQHELPEPRYARATLDALKRHDWPGNVRELRNFSERMVILFAGRDVYPDNLPTDIRPVDAGAGAREPSFQLPETGIRLFDLERDLLVQALEKSGGNRCQAARLLGLTRDTLMYRLKKYAIVV